MCYGETGFNYFLLYFLDCKSTSNDSHIDYVGITYLTTNTLVCLTLPLITDSHSYNNQCMTMHDDMHA